MRAARCSAATDSNLTSHCSNIFVAFSKLSEIPSMTSVSTWQLHRWQSLFKAVQQVIKRCYIALPSFLRAC